MTKKQDSDSIKQMATDVFVWIVLGIVQIGTAIYGGIMSIKTKDKDRTRNIVVFVVLGVVGAILIIYSGVRTYDTQKANEQTQKELRQQVQAANEKMAQSLMSQEYMKGQLNSIGTVMTKIGEKSTDPVLGQMANTISKLAGNSTSKEKGDDTPFYSSGNLTSATLIVSGKGIMGDISIKTSNNCSVTCYDGISKTDDPRAVVWDLPCVNLSCFASASRAFNKGLYCVPSQTTNCTYNVSYKSQ